MTTPVGFPPKAIARQLRLEGLFALVAAVTAYWFLGGNWWLFAILLLAPDLTAEVAQCPTQQAGCQLDPLRIATHPEQLLRDPAGDFEGCRMAVFGRPLDLQIALHHQIRCYIRNPNVLGESGVTGP